MALFPGNDRTNDDEIGAELIHSCSSKKTTRRAKVHAHGISGLSESSHLSRSRQYIR